MTRPGTNAPIGDRIDEPLPAHRLLLELVLAPRDHGLLPAFERLDPEGLQAFVDAACHHFVSPLVLERLGRGRQAGTGSEAMRQLTLDAGKTARRSLLIAATLSELHRDHLEPLGIAYAAFKGVSLASRYYGQLAQRSCRDLDLLVDRPAIPGLAARLLEAGFSLSSKFRPPADGNLRDYIDALAYLTSEFSLVSPGGVVIEIHSRLDLTGPGFAPKRLLARRERCEVAGANVPVLPTEDLFAFICYHHSRHRWSRLHWLADLTMMMDHPSFDAGRVRHRARQAGVAHLVDDCMALPDALRARLAGERPDDRRPLLSQLVTYCTTYVDPSVPPPEEIRVGAEDDPRSRMRERLSNTAWDFRARDTLALKLVTGLTQLRPHLPDYSALPLPRRLHAVYWFTRPFRLLMKAAERRG
jgi:hypothetical protein